MIEVVAKIVREKRQPTENEIRIDAEPLVESRDLPRFIDLAKRELKGLREGNIARYRVRLAEFQDWSNSACR